MLASKFKFYAFTTPGLERVLNKEINKVSSSHVSNVFGKYGVQFQGNLLQMLEVLTHAKTLTRLVVQIGHPFHATSPKSLKALLPLANLQSFFDMRKPDYRPPHIICSTLGSKLSDDKEVAQILRDYFQTEQMKLLGDGASQEEKKDSPFETLYVNCYNDKIMLNYGIFHHERDKEKTEVGRWNASHNIYIHGLIETMGWTEGENKSLKLFDPLCNTGELFGEICANLSNQPLRTQLIPFLSFWNWPILSKPKKKEFLIESLEGIKNKPVEMQPVKVSLVGFTARKEKFREAAQMIEELKRARVFEKLSTAGGSTLSELRQMFAEKGTWTKSCKDKILISNCSLGEIDWAKNESLRDFSFICNLIDVREDAELFKVLIAFLKRESHRFAEIIVLAKQNLSTTNFITFSGFTWGRKASFFVKGRKVGIFRLKSFVKPPTNYMVEITVKKLRRRKKPLIIKQKYDLRRIGSIRTNSKASNEIKQKLVSKLRNIKLTSEKAEKKVFVAKAQQRAEKLENKATQKVLLEAKKYLNDEQFQKLQKRIPKN